MGRKYTPNPKRPITFSLNDHQIEEIHRRVESSSMKNRSEWLSSVIENSSMIEEMTTVRILAHLLETRTELFEHISRSMMVKIIQEMSK